MNPYFEEFKVYPFTNARQSQSSRTGENAKGLLIVYSATEENQEALLDFLAKIVKAVNFELQQDTITINLSPTESISLAEFNSEFPYTKALIFGVSLQKLGLHFDASKYRPIKISDKQYLIADELDLIYQERQRGEKQKAGLLWKAMKQLFE